MGFRSRHNAHEVVLRRQVDVMRIARHSILPNGSLSLGRLERSGFARAIWHYVKSARTATAAQTPALRILPFGLSQRFRSAAELTRAADLRDVYRARTQGVRPLLLFILALGVIATWLVSGDGLMLPAVAAVATVIAGVSAGPLVRAARAADYKPGIADFPPVPLGLHSASLILLLALIIVGLIR